MFPLTRGAWNAPHLKCTHVMRARLQQAVLTHCSAGGEQVTAATVNGCPLLTAAIVICSSLQPQTCWAEPAGQQQLPQPHEQQHTLVGKLRRLIQGTSEQAPAIAATKEQQPVETPPNGNEGRGTSDADAAAEARKRDAAVQALQAVLGVEQRDAEGILVREPSLLVLSKRQMQGNLHKLAKLVKLPSDQARHAAAQMPRLLSLDPKEARQRLQQVGKLLGVDGGKAAELAGQQPGLLLHSSETLRLRLRNLQALLQLKPAAAQHLAAKEPGLLTFRSQELRARMDHLTEKLNLPPHRADSLVTRVPALLTLLPRTLLDERVLALGPLLGLQFASDAASAAARAPAVLLQPEGLIKAQISNLGRILEVSPSEAVGIAAQQPALLLVPPQLLRSRVEALAAALKVDVEDAKIVAVKRPALLVAPPDVLFKAAQEAGVP